MLDKKIIECLDARQGTPLKRFSLRSKFVVETLSYIVRTYSFLIYNAVIVDLCLYI